MLLTMYISGAVAVVALVFAHVLWGKKTAAAALAVAVAIIASAVALLFSFLSVAPWVAIGVCAFIAVYSIILVIVLMFVRESHDYYQTHKPVTRDIDRPVRELSHEQRQPVMVEELVDRKES